jgi:hypothetical protein
MLSLGVASLSPRVSTSTVGAYPRLFSVLVPRNKVILDEDLEIVLPDDLSARPSRVFKPCAAGLNPHVWPNRASRSLSPFEVTDKYRRTSFLDIGVAGLGQQRGAAWVGL